MKTRQKKEPLKDASHLYEVEHRAYHLSGPAFQFSELQLTRTQRCLGLPHERKRYFYVLAAAFVFSCRTQSRRFSSASAKATR